MTGWGTDLDYCDTEWFALEMNRDHSVIYEIASQYCILDSFVDYHSYTVSSKVFLQKSKTAKYTEVYKHKKKCEWIYKYVYKPISKSKQSNKNNVQ